MKFPRGMKLEVMAPSDSRKRRKRIVEGEVIQSTDYLVTIKTKIGYSESFSYADFETGRAVLI